MTKTEIPLATMGSITMTKRLLIAALLVSTCGYTLAQFLADDPDWKESDVGAPPAFDLKRLVPVDVSVRSQLKWGVDPATVKILPEGIVRYVVVAQSPSGVVNAMYEGIRCNKAEFRSYARHNPDSGWVKVTNSEWTALRNSGGANHHAALAKQGLCDGAAPAASVQEAMRQLRQGPRLGP